MSRALERSSGSVAGPSLLDRIALRVMFSAARRIRYGRLAVTLPDGARHVFGAEDAAPLAELHVLDYRAARMLLLGGDLGAGEAYMDGLWASPDLPKLAKVASVNRDGLGLTSGWWRVPAKLGKTIAHRLHRNTVSGSKRNIAAHYDLGNDFYRLFLDETMTYSSAVFESPTQSLADAQRTKYRRMAEGAGLRRGMHVLEIGTGWGGFALYAAGELGCRVTTVTISKEQHRLATERVRAAGLEELVSVQLRDYREIDGVYDAIVSIEMFEAVGAEYFTTFFEACDMALRPGGRLSMQTIAFPDLAFGPQVRGANWIQTYIFPGGVLPSLAAIERSLHGTHFVMRSVEDIAEHYVRTLAAWRTRFMSRLEDVRSMGFDERFIRMWEYYLTISEAGFDTGVCQDYQLVLEKGRALPSRALAEATRR
ncbi:MAG TPA: cyclopropane-fatty-acyl-phospholipid synthase family protein [Candidatus Limnocylindrales bacterium]|jgi:cyclopropane-fatty-acyl-phospholipid synthase|nr:cyclopropane-fatty-acyl-phospholipid synthase family protein [Candidatus Limnocylindrales bacterium]